jgi:hypothetical protein
VVTFKRRENLLAVNPSLARKGCTYYLNPSLDICFILEIIFVKQVFLCRNFTPSVAQLIASASATAETGSTGAQLKISL